MLLEIEYFYEALRNLYYPALQVACFNDIHCNFGVHHLEYSVRHLEYLLEVYIEL